MAGLIRHNNEGAIDFAKRAKITLPEHVEAIEQITASFVSLQYGKAPNHADFVKFKQLEAKFHLRKRN